ncbi:hypothetical protein CVT26_002403 [Gymnopilus dilepis]|uniref:Uncharacterized protein n=1 Tax=Gymnopilus dilepis TaxID=231916 RepID=A0A409Y3I2_9AGAR|nr:hypothetical protein CVT26_002403 [Gymnopilus dilepis]
MASPYVAPATTMKYQILVGQEVITVTAEERDRMGDADDEMMVVKERGWPTTSASRTQNTEFAGRSTLADLADLAS